MKVLMVGLFALLTTEAGASSPAPKSDVADRVKAVMPKGWTVETRGLAAGVLAMFRGPVAKPGQATVTIARLDERTNGPEDQAAVEAAFGESGMLVSYRAQGAFGGPELESRRGDFTVRQWVVPGSVSYLVTAAAPQVMIEQTAKEIFKAIETLRRPTPKPKEAALDTKPTKRPDGALLGAETVRQAD